MDDRMRLDVIDLNACFLFVSRRSGGGGYGTHMALALCLLSQS